MSKIGIEQHDNVFYTLEKLEEYEDYTEVEMSQKEIDHIFKVQGEWDKIQDRLRKLEEKYHKKYIQPVGTTLEGHTCTFGAVHDEVWV